MKKLFIVPAICAVISALFCVSATAFADLDEDGVLNGNITTVGTKAEYTVNFVSDDTVYVPEKYKGMDIVYLDTDGTARTDITKLTVEAKELVIAENAFKGYTALEDIELGDGIRAIGENAFADTAYYNHIGNWEDGGLYIDDCLIRVSEWISGTFEVKSGTVLIADGCFRNCKKIDRVVLPDSVVSIGANAFANTGITNNEANYDEDGALYIDGYLISYAGSGAVYTVKEGTKAVASEAFAKAKDLEELIVSEGVVSIGERAVSDCKTLKKAVLPESLEYIGNGAFGGEAFAEYAVDEDNMRYSAYDGILYNKVFSVLIRCPAAMTEANIHEKTEIIEAGAFEGCTALEKAELPEGVIKIYEKAFFGCKALGEIILPDTLTEIGSEAFAECDSLESVNVSGNVEQLNTYVFSGCDSLKEVVLGESVTWIFDYAFKDCDALEIIDIKSEEVGYFSAKAFDGADIADDIYNYDSNGLLIISDRFLVKAIDTEDGIYRIPEGVTNISDYCFESVGNVEKVYLPESVRCIDESAFENRGSFNSLIYPGTFKELKRIFDGWVWYDYNVITEPEGVMSSDVLLVAASVICAVALYIICVKYRPVKQK